MKRWFTFGFYSMFAKGNRVDWNKVVADIKASKFSGLSLHLTSPWDQDFENPFFPWPFTNGKYLLDRRNNEWYDELKKVVRLFMQNKLDLELSLFDRYFETGKSWSHYIKNHPFRDNNIGIKWTRDFQLFNSLENIKSPPFIWISWSDLSKAEAHKWNSIGEIGTALFDYVFAVLDIVQAAMLEFPFPKSRISIKPFNEQISGDTDRHEIIQWLQDEGDKRGLETSRRFFWIFDYGVRGAANQAEYEEKMLGGYNGYVRDKKNEIHSVGEQWNHHFYLNIGMLRKKCVFSTDGVPAGLNEAAIKKLWSDPDNVLFADGKMEEGDIPEVASGQINWMKIKDPMKKWNLAFPHHAEYLE